MSNSRLLLEEYTHDKVLNSINLQACDDGNIYLRTPTGSFKLLYNEITYIDGIAYIFLEAHEGSRSKLLYAVRDSKIYDIVDYMRIWHSAALTKLRDDKWKSFLLFWNYTLNFIRDNVDITNVTYKLYATDYRQYEGDLNLHFDVHLTDDYSDSYDDYFNLQELWFDGYYDLHKAECDDGKEYYWFSNIFVSFKP